ncbi:heterokaryon incompatibility protein-domain-containing protein, partial [Bisporella sp. PMI_857]
VYQYVPLPKGSFTRVIVLQPAGKKEDELHCDIQPLNLDDQFYTYDALSYVWGQPVFSDTLYCAGQCIKITPTLSSALRRFRSRTVSRRLWADAVCINQRDNEEKAVQVQEMARIYLRARSVLIYLGEPFRG